MCIGDEDFWIAPLLASNTRALQQSLNSSNQSAHQTKALIKPTAANCSHESNANLLQFWSTSISFVFEVSITAADLSRELQPSVVLPVSGIDRPVDQGLRDSD